MNQATLLSSRELDRIVGGRIATNPPTSIDIWAFFRAFAGAAAVTPPDKVPG